MVKLSLMIIPLGIVAHQLWGLTIKKFFMNKWFSFWSFHYSKTKEVSLTAFHCDVSRGPDET